MEEHSSKINQAFKSSFALELTGKIMVITVIILFLIIVFVLILQLYSKWFKSRIDDSTPTSNAHRRQEPAVVTFQKGLDAAVLRSLPVMIFSPESFKDGLECAVCLSELTKGEKARLLPKCEHGFHVDCIDMWFQSNSTCPLCRNPVSVSDSKGSHLGEELESRNENLDSGNSSSASSFMESPIFPTNVLFWGDETQVSSREVCLEEGSTTSSSRPDGNGNGNGMVAIDIPNEPSSSSGGGCFGDEETKTAVTTRLRTLKRLLSRERRSSNSPIAVDLEQAGRGQS